MILERIHDIQTKGSAIYYVHIPSHVGIPWNDYVDKLAVAKDGVRISLPLNSDVLGDDSNHSNGEVISFVKIPFWKRDVYFIIETKAKPQLHSYRNLRPLALSSIPMANRQIYDVLRTIAYQWQTDKSTTSSEQFRTDTIACATPDSRGLSTSVTRTSNSNLSVAFDTIDHEIVLKRLQQRIGFTGTVLS